MPTPRPTSPPDGLILAIETSNPGAATDRGPAPGVALGRTGPSGLHLLGAESLRPTGRHDDDLMPAIDRLFKRFGAAPAQLHRVAVSVGPGGYTALRIAVATAKMLAEATGTRCIAVPTAMVAAWAWRSSAAYAPSPFAVALAGKDAGPHGGTAWVAVFRDPGGDLVAPARAGSIIGPDQVAALGVRRLIADRHLPAGLRDAATAANISISPPTLDPTICLQIAASGLIPDTDPADLLPLYPREPEAVALWKARNPSPSR